MEFNQKRCVDNSIKMATVCELTELEVNKEEDILTERADGKSQEDKQDDAKSPGLWLKCLTL